MIFILIFFLAIKITLLFKIILLNFVYLNILLYICNESRWNMWLYNSNSNSNLNFIKIRTFGEKRAPCLFFNQRNSSAALHGSRRAICLNLVKLEKVVLTHLKTLCEMQEDLIRTAFTLQMLIKKKKYWKYKWFDQTDFQINLFEWSLELCSNFKIVRSYVFN